MAATSQLIGTGLGDFPFKIPSEQHAPKLKVFPFSPPQGLARNREKRASLAAMRTLTGRVLLPKPMDLKKESGYGIFCLLRLRCQSQEDREYSGSFPQDVALGNKSLCGSWCRTTGGMRGPAPDTLCPVRGVTQGQVAPSPPATATPSHGKHTGTGG